MRVPLLNFEGGPGVLLLNFEGGPGVPLLNFEGGPGSQGPEVPGSWSHFYTMMPFRGVPRKRCSENMQQIYRRTPMPKCDFSKAEHLRRAALHNIHKMLTEN